MEQHHNLKNQCLQSRFKDVANEWLVSKTYKIKESTLNKYKYLFERYIYPQFSTLRMKDISTAVIDKNMMELYEKYKDCLSYSTFKSMIYLIKAVIGYAVKAEYITQVYFNFEIAKRTSQKEIQVLTQEQEKTIVAEIMANKNANNLGILLSLYTGIRLGEVCSLRVSDIDFTSRTVNISKTVQRLSDFSTNTSNLIITTPKSQRSIRIIPLPEFLFEILLSYGIDNYSGNCFILNNKELPYEPRTLQYAFQRLVAKCGYEGFHFHCLRHTFATRCVQSGFDIKTLSEILGHANASFTMNRYVHSDLDAKRKQMDILNESWVSMDIYIS